MQPNGTFPFRCRPRAAAPCCAHNEERTGPLIALDSARESTYHAMWLHTCAVFPRPLQNTGQRHFRASVRDRSRETFP
jgi:hypothetical protein